MLKRPVLKRGCDAYRARGEDGNLVLAMSVLMILTFLSVATLARSLGTLTSVRRTQDYSAALAAADAGLSDALFQIDQVRAVTFSGTGTVGAQTFSYTSTYVDQNTWFVQSQGSANGVKHAVRAKVSREVAYPYALFTNQDVTLNGNSTDSITSYDSVTGATNTHHALIGSNRAITVNGGGGGDGQHYFNPDGSCSGCSNGQQRQGPRPVPPPTRPTTSQPCPVAGLFTGVVNGAGGLAFLCEATDVAFVGLVKVINPPLVVYVGNDHAVSIADAGINTVTASGIGSPAARDFRLLKAGSGAFNIGNGSHAGSLVGVVYAPDTDITIEGGQAFIDGSLTVNQLRINGSPNFTMRYDDSVATISADNWVVSDWREVPST